MADPLKSPFAWSDSTVRSLGGGVLASGAAALYMTTSGWSYPPQVPEKRVENLQTSSAIFPRSLASTATTPISLLTPTAQDAIELKIDQMHLELSRAINALDARIERIASGRFDAGAEVSHQQTVADFEQAAHVAAASQELDKLAYILDEAADYGASSPTLAELARAAITSDDSILRTAAARLLAITDAASAREVIPGLIQRAEGPTSKHLLEVALRTASVE